jgi:hypothetical protein
MQAFISRSCRQPSTRYPLQIIRYAWYRSYKHRRLFQAVDDIARTRIGEDLHLGVAPRTSSSCVSIAPRPARARIEMSSRIVPATCRCKTGLCVDKVITK